MLRLKGHGSRNPVPHVTFFPDGARLASASWGSDALRVWDLTTGGHEDAGSGRGWCRPAFSPDGARLAAGAFRRVLVFDTALQQVKRLATSSEVLGVCFLPDGQSLAVVEHHRLRHYRPADGAASRVRAFSRLMNYCPPAFAPAAGLLATVHRGGASYWELELRYWDFRSGEGRGECRLGRGVIPAACAFSPDGRLVALTSGPALQVREVASGAAVLEHRAARHHLKAVAFSPDGRYLASGSNDATVQLWDTRTWRECAAYNWGVGRVTALAFSPDGMRAAAGSYTGKIVVWDVDL